MRKFLIAAVIVVCLGLAGFGVYRVLEAQVLSPDKLPANVSINGINCSNMTTAEAQKKLQDEWNKKTLKITHNGKEIAEFTKFGFDYAIDDAVINLKRDHFFQAVMNHYFGAKLDVTTEMEVSKISRSFIDRVKATKAFTPEKAVITKDATIDLSSDDFKIIPEVRGTNTDFEVLVGEMVTAIASGEMKMDYVAEQFYAVPKITADSEEIAERRKFCQEYLASKVTYTLGGKSVPISPAEIDKMIEVVYPNQNKGKALITAKKKKVKKFVEKFNQKHHTIGVRRKFKALSGNQVSVKGGDYGYFIDVKKETDQLVKDLEHPEKITREPIWSQKGWGAYDPNNDIGNTYVEISISQQHLWYFKKGKKLVDCNVVTGDTVGGTITPTGTFGLTFKERGATLRGYNTDGTTYESPVTYWMPFYGNYGMHDAPWRGSFGGSIYRGNGSHGCVNMPPSSAAKLFRNLASVGTPVIVHD